VLVSALLLCTASASEQLLTWESACVKVLLTEIQMDPYF